MEAESRGRGPGGSAAAAAAEPRPSEAETLRRYHEGLRLVLEALTVDSVPEVGMNLAYAPAGARGAHDLVGLAGRIVRAGRTGRFAVGGAPELGAPGHTGTIALALLSVEPGPWWVLNHRFEELFLANAERAGLVLGSFDRAAQPADAPSTMEWGTRHAVQQLGRVPDGVWDRGAWGKEPMMRLFARAPDELARKVRVVRG